MPNDPHFVTSPSIVEAERNQPPKLVGVYNLLAQALSIYLVVRVAFPYPSTSNAAVATTLCLALTFVGFKTLQRTFFSKHLPARWDEEDPKVLLARRFQTGLMILLVLISAIGLSMLFSGVPHHSRHLGWVLFPVVIVVSGISDSLQDRLPLRPRRVAGNRAKIWASMKPIHSDHWGERNAS